jgi:hypothetical protein
MTKQPTAINVQPIIPSVARVFKITTAKSIAPEWEKFFYSLQAWECNQLTLVVVGEQGCNRDAGAPHFETNNELTIKIKLFFL